MLCPMYALFSHTNSGGDASLVAPVLVVAPSTLVHHWATEAKRFFSTFYNNTIVYTGTPAHRKQLALLIQQQQPEISTTATTTSISQKMKGTKRSKTAATQKQQHTTAAAAVTLVVTSYAVLQRDTAVLSSRRWSYCILDEAHLLRNPDAAAARAVVTLQCDHRLALTGTPIQNTVAELWSIFHCIMPGYLGERTDFRSRYVCVYY
jgi:SNF2 family DNA or RNA helicase